MKDYIKRAGHIHATPAKRRELKMLHKFHRLGLPALAVVVEGFNLRLGPVVLCRKEM